MIAALGLSSRPSFLRTCARSASWMRSQMPVSRQVRYYVCTVLHFGRSCGKDRHWQPVLLR